MVTRPVGDQSDVCMNNTLNEVGSKSHWAVRLKLLIFTPRGIYILSVNSLISYTEE